MPNWCNNVVEISHEDKDQLIAIKEAFDEGKLLETFIPCPQELLDTVEGYFGDTEEQAKLNERLANNRAKYGYESWYNWRLDNWGTKWDVGGTDCNSSYVDDNTLELSFDSAWSPPIEAYNKLLEMGFEITAYYYEPGCHFAGIYRDGNDTCYSGWENAEAELPAELDDMFSISEMESECELDDAFEDNE